MKKPPIQTPCHCMNSTDLRDLSSQRSESSTMSCLLFPPDAAASGPNSPRAPPMRSLEPESMLHAPASVQPQRQAGLGRPIGRRNSGGLAARSTAGIRRPTWAPTTSSAQQFPGCSRSQAQQPSAADGPLGLRAPRSRPQSLTLHHLVAMSRANTSARRCLSRVSASPQLRIRVPSMLCP